VPQPAGGRCRVDREPRHLHLFPNRMSQICSRKVRMFEGLFQPTHLLVILGIALLIFGPKKLPELGKGIGEGIRGLKSAMNAEQEKPAITTSAANQSIASEE
jgi:sec-independent protein translocase protein TatA